jgi:hypothetical protein
MTPHAKAIDLFNEYYSYLKANLMYDEEARQDAKQGALIAVDEVLQLCWNGNLKAKEYWEEVKQEILNL